MDVGLGYPPPQINAAYICLAPSGDLSDNGSDVVPVDRCPPTRQGGKLRKIKGVVFRSRVAVQSSNLPSFTVLLKSTETEH